MAMCDAEISRLREALSRAEALHKHDRQMWDATRRRAEAAEAALAAETAAREKAERERDAEKSRQHREFWDVEKERQAVCLAVKHHSNSGTAVSAIVREKMAELTTAEATIADLTRKLEVAAGALEALVKEQAGEIRELRMQMLSDEGQTRDALAKGGG
jgi:hypothetical protein